MMKFRIIFLIIFISSYSLALKAENFGLYFGYNRTYSTFEKDFTKLNSRGGDGFCFGLMAEYELFPNVYFGPGLGMDLKKIFYTHDDIEIRREMFGLQVPFLGTYKWQQKKKAYFVKAGVTLNVAMTWADITKANSLYLTFGKEPGQLESTNIDFYTEVGYQYKRTQFSVFYSHSFNDFDHSNGNVFRIYHFGFKLGYLLKQE